MSDETVKVAHGFYHRAFGDWDPRRIGAPKDTPEAWRPLQPVEFTSGPTIITLPAEHTYDERASKLADECGRLQSENRELAAENAKLRRRVEALDRKR